MKIRHKQKTSDHRHSIKALEERMRHFRVPGGPFDYAVRGAAVAEAHEFYNTAFQLRKRSPHDSDLAALHTQAVRLWHQAMEAAYPPIFWDDWERLRQGNKAGLESAVQFLEADPIFFRTGYIKAKLIRSIKPPMLTTDTIARLQKAVLHVVDSRDDRDFRAYCRLARKVDGPELRSGLRQRMTSPDPKIRRRARWVTEALPQDAGLVL